MKNFTISLCMFLIMLILIFISIKKINTFCENYILETKKLENLLNEERWDSAYNMSVEFVEDWKESSKFISIFVHHQEIDNINNALLELTQYIKFEDKTEALAKVHFIKFILTHLIDLEKITLQNIL